MTVVPCSDNAVVMGWIGGTVVVYRVVAAVVVVVVVGVLIV